MKTSQEVKDEFRSKGVSIAAWARAKGFQELAVHRVISGKSKCYRGNAHKIAVLLGLKNGEITEM